MPPDTDRPVPWPTDAEFCAVIARTSRPGDRLILLVLRMHDYDRGLRGPYPGYKRVAALTGLSPSYVRHRLAAMVKASALKAERLGRNTIYYIVPPGTEIESPRANAQASPHRDSRDDEPLYDDQGRPSAALRALADEYWPGRAKAKGKL